MMSQASGSKYVTVQNFPSRLPKYMEGCSQISKRKERLPFNLDFAHTSADSFSTLRAELGDWCRDSIDILE